MSTALLVPNAREPIGYPVSVKKMAIMHVATLGLYDLYWAYRNFTNLYNPQRSPVIRGIFAVFISISFYGMLKRLQELARHIGHPLRLNAAVLGAAFFLINFLPGRFMNDVPVIVYLIPPAVAAIPLCIAQAKINELNAATRPTRLDNNFSAADWVGVGIGALFWLLTIIVTVLPP